MQGESPSKASTPAGAVFLSYASQDAEAAKRIYEALRAAGIEVWFDQSELRGGEAWDRSIHEEIQACALFMPIISANAHARVEGYFRLEWKLAVDRSHRMAPDQPFLMPVVIDETRQSDTRIPDRFRELQWSRLPAGDTTPAFVQRIQHVLSGQATTMTRARAASAAVSEVGGRSPAFRRSRFALLAVIGVVIFGAVAYLAINEPWISKPPPASPTPAPAAPTAFAPPPHSIAVLPFVNLSGDASQDYFSEGLTEEVLNSLAQISDLQVAARTSSFSFKEHPDIVTVAHKLNVAAVLEGSVRRSAQTVRVTAQLINAVTGFHLWSKTYDRDLGDVLKLQTEIATAVAEALKVTLLGDISQKIELGGTRNSAALDAYLRAAKAFQSIHDAADIPPAIAAYSEAIRLDPNYALAFASRSSALTLYTRTVATGAAAREGFAKAESDARRSLALAPELAEAHLALALVSSGTLDFALANEEYERAVALAPGNVRVLRANAHFAAVTGHFEAAIAAARRAVVLDPLDRRSHTGLAEALYAARRYGETAAAYSEAISLDPDYKPAYGWRGLAFYGLGDFESARASCEAKRDDWVSQRCLAVVYDKLGRHADAQAELRKYQAALGDAAPYEYATTYAQWGDRAKALEWLDTAMRLRDSSLINLTTDPLTDPLRKEPRFQAIERELKFPR